MVTLIFSEKTVKSLGIIYILFTFALVASNRLDSLESLEESFFDGVNQQITSQQQPTLGDTRECQTLTD